eukprot:Ihof_evm22s10 gene=Ihof_evmTU22s10
MTRGNQREKAREKNLKKTAEKKKQEGHSGINLLKKMETDAEIMRRKQAAALLKKEADAAAKAQ